MKPNSSGIDATRGNDESALRIERFLTTISESFRNGEDLTSAWRFLAKCRFIPLRGADGGRPFISAVRKECVS